jgi:hypothetical protein
MDQNQALDDLKAIRQIMDRARRTSGGGGGWFMVVWGIILFIGFSGSQFLPDVYLGGMWAVLNILGMVISVWLGIRMGQHSGISLSSIWRSILFWWLSLGIFDALLVWLFHLDGHDMALLSILTVALGYVLFGLFTHWSISAVGALMAILAVGATLLIPSYFSLAIGVLVGGLLIGSGLWLIRKEG